MNEREFRTEDDPKTEQTSESCPDCGAKRGQKHSIFCEWDQCPVCGIQAIQCFEHCYRKDGHRMKVRLSFIRGRIRMKDWHYPVFRELGSSTEQGEVIS
jgi:hypothetical protein